MRSKRPIAIVATSLLVAWAIGAQTAPGVALRIEPKVGDSFRTRYESEVEMTGTTRRGDGDTTVTSRLRVLLLSHIQVQGSGDRGTVVVATTDSVALDGSGASGQAPSEAQRRAMQGKQARLRIAADGSATLLEASDDVSPEVEAVFSGMPSTLPARPVAVGTSWEKVMPIPVAGENDAAHAATLRAVSRLDSVSSDGTLAYISLRGTISRDSTAAGLARGLRMVSAGNVAGNLLLDRHRGWWRESHLTITMKSTLTPPPGSTARPMRVIARVVQSMSVEGPQ